MDVNEVVSELLEVANSWAVAEREHDTDFLQAALTEDFVGICLHGSTLTKWQWISRFNPSGPRRQMSLHSENIQVRIYGDVAILSSDEGQDPPTFTDSRSMKIERAALGIDSPLQTTLIFVRRMKNWKLAGCQMRPG